jgi:Card1-like, endonuclease domain
LPARRQGCLGDRLETGTNTGNEFDVLATERNQLLFVECKTLRHREENDNMLAYKVDSLGQDARGLFGATWLVTAREPSSVLHERARQARIRIFGPSDLRHLREHVLAWLEGKG